MKYSCGCINEVDEASGVFHCVEKCEFHVRWSLEHPQGESLQYFKELNLIDGNGVSYNRRLIHELPYDLPKTEVVEPTVLELGCGLGSYVPMFLKHGWDYEAVERSKFASDWTRNVFDVHVANCSFEDFEYDSYDMIFAAHFFEHVLDAPAMLRKAHNMLLSDGYLYLVVPNGNDDPTNPDHYWFFNPYTLESLLYKTGFLNIRMCERKVIERERFVYCTAQRP